MPNPRRSAALALAVLVGGASLTACSSGDADAGEEVTLTFSWWGNDARTERTQEVIDLFEQENPNITIEAEYTDWSGYWDKLATQSASGETADIMQFDGGYLSTYGSNGLLYDLNDLEGLDTESIPDWAITSGTWDGSLYGLAASENSGALVANTSLFEEAGIELPDDTAWTWDDLADLASRLSDASGGEFSGIDLYGFSDYSLGAWARQHGEELYSDDGEVGISADTAASWWQYQLDLLSSGASTTAAQYSESAAGTLAEHNIVTGKAALQFWPANQLTALEEAAGDDLTLLRPPTVEGSSDDYSAYYNVSMYWAVSATTEHPEEAAAFLNFLENSEEAADILLVERGLPVNESIVEHIEPALTENDAEVATYLTDLADVAGEGRAPTPPGASSLAIGDYTSRVLFGESATTVAADFVADLKTAIADAG